MTTITRTIRTHSLARSIAAGVTVTEPSAPVNVMATIRRHAITAPDPFRHVVAIDECGAPILSASAPDITENV